MNTYVAIQAPVVVLKLAHKNIHWAFHLKCFQQQVSLLLLVDPCGKATVVIPCCGTWYLPIAQNSREPSNATFSDVFSP